MRESSKTGENMGAVIKKALKANDPIKVEGHWQMTCRAINGEIKWVDTWDNIVVDEGLNLILSNVLKLVTPQSAWYVGILNNAVNIAPGDTMASHTWTEVTAYSPTRPTWVGGSVASQSVDNSGTPASFGIDTDDTVIDGAFLVSDSTIGGAAGTLYAAGGFSAGSKSLDNGDTLEVTATFTTSSV